MAVRQWLALDVGEAHGEVEHLALESIDCIGEGVKHYAGFAGAALGVEIGMVAVGAEAGGAAVEAVGGAAAEAAVVVVAVEVPDMAEAADTTQVVAVGCWRPWRVIPAAALKLEDLVNLQLNCLTRYLSINR